MGHGVSDTGMDLSVRLVEAIALGHRDAVQNSDVDIRTCHFTCGSCDFKSIFKYISLVKSQKLKICPLIKLLYIKEPLENSGREGKGPHGPYLFNPCCFRVWG